LKLRIRFLPFNIDRQIASVMQLQTARCVKLIAWNQFIWCGHLQMQSQCSCSRHAATW